MKRFCQSLYQNEGRRWALAALLAAAVLIFAAVSSTVCYYDVDDFNIAWALAGYRSGTPSFSHPFINCIMAAIVSGLYSLLPRLPWWFLVQWAALYAGMTAVFASLLKIGAKKKMPWLLPLALCGVLAGGVYFYGTVLVTFTLSSTMAGMGGVVMLLALDSADSQRRQRGYWIGSIALMVVSLLVRQSSGLCVLCFWFGTALYRIVAQGMQNRAAEQKTDRMRSLRRGIAGCVCMAVCTVLLMTANAYGREKLNPAGFLEFEEGRADFMDYPHDSYYENPKLYEAVGWDSTLYELASAWCYMDARINADTLTEICEASRINQRTIGQQLSDTPETFMTFLGKYPIARHLLTMTGAALLLVLLLWIPQRKRWLPAATGLTLTLGGAALIGYLCFTGRINLRSFMTVAFPLIVCLFVLAQEQYEKKKFAFAAFVLCTVLALYPAQRIFRTVLSYESDAEIARARTVTDYVLEHPENVYIRDVYAAINYDALSVYPNVKPTNLMDWGGCDTKTAAREAQLAINGLTSAYADVFFQPNVYYLCEADGPYLPLLTEYMETTMGASGYEVADEIVDGLLAVRFLPAQ